MQAQGESRGIALLILNLGARWGWVVNATPGRFTPERLGEPLGRSRRERRRENLLPPPSGVRTPNCPAWSGSLTDYPIPSLHTHTHTHTHTQCIYKCSINVNIEARSRNQCCRGKEMSTAYAECVPVALVIQHIMRMRCVILSATSLALQSFSILSHTWYFSR